MKRIIVTGAAGFIGSHLCERLLMDKNIQITGIDSFLNPSLRKYKEQNVMLLKKHPRFQLITDNLMDIDWDLYLPDADVIFHLAGMPGVRSSWGKDFDSYVINNINVTQRLLEGCRSHPVEKFIYASTSSVYGEKMGKVKENAETDPLSPYGVTKLTGENLCRVYQKTDNIPVTILRYFTVYGPRQRCDMAFHRFIQCFLQDLSIPVFGDGRQTRDFTYVSDCVEGTAAVLHAKNTAGEIINIGGKERASILDIISLLEEITGKKPLINFSDKPKGEPLNTWAHIEKAEKLLNYKPVITLKEGLEKEIKDLEKYYLGI